MPSVLAERARPNLPAEVRELYEEAGLSQAATARVLGVPISTVRGIMRRYGIPPRGQGGAGGGGRRVPHAEMERTVFLYEQLELSQSEVAEVLGIERSTVHFRLTRAGVRSRSASESTRLRFARRPPRAPLGVSLRDAA